MVQRIDKIMEQRNALTTQRTSLPASQQKMMQLVSKYGDRDTFLTRYNPDYQRQICANDDVCFFGDFPTLSTLRAGYGNNAPVMWLVPQLYNLSEYCGCREKLQGKPLEECAYVIASEFHYLKVSELMLFFHRFKTARYGRFYGSVDPLIITESLRKFCDERWHSYEQRKQEQAEQQDREHRENAVTYEQYQQMKKEGKI
ncbi:MAG: hypothetical protein Q4F85_11815 [Prevotella sp.]|nr:hypothetical protein [Prevotella sp.]